MVAALLLVARVRVSSLGLLRRRIATKEEMEGARALVSEERARPTAAVGRSTKVLPLSASEIDLGRTRV